MLTLFCKKLHRGQNTLARVRYKYDHISLALAKANGNIQTLHNRVQYNSAEQSAILLVRADV